MNTIKTEGSSYKNNPILSVSKVFNQPFDEMLKIATLFTVRFARKEIVFAIKFLLNVHSWPAVRDVRLIDWLPTKATKPLALDHSCGIHASFKTMTYVILHDRN